MDVMFYEVFEEEEVLLKRFLPSSIVAEYTAETIQTRRSTFAPASLISIRTQSQIPVSWADALHGILTRSTGCDHLRTYQSQCGKMMPCGYLPFYCARAVAEHAVMMMMCLLRRVKKQMIQLETFHRNGLTGAECLNRCLLIIGVGNIGQEVVKIGRGLGMNVRGVDLVRRVPDLEYVTVEEGIPRADAIICALPLTEQTRGMLDFRQLCRAARSPVFVNVGRGEVSPAADLQRLLDENILNGLALDVFEDEGCFADCLRTGNRLQLSESGKILWLLKDRAQVILTPHNAFNTAEAIEKKAAQTCESVLQFLKKGTFPSPV